MIHRGEIYYADLSPVVGSEQGGYRPVIVLQNNKGNQHSTTVIVAAITDRPKKELPVHVAIQAQGLREHSIVLLEQVRTVDKEQLGDYIGRADGATMDRIDYALRISIGLRKRLNPMELTLCPACVHQYWQSPYHRVIRKDKQQEVKERCTFCNYRWGYDYLVYEKEVIS